MNKTKLKSYAPQARKDFIAAVTARANLLGLSDKAGRLEVAISQPQGDVTVIAGQAWQVKVHSQRDQLVTRIQRDGFAQTMEAVAYTWFNRFAAQRYMELHDYLGHGHRALSSTSGALPDILTNAADLAQGSALPGLKSALVTEMKLAGNRDGELYRMLLVAQCNALSVTMPFLFERIDDETELLLPDNLLRTDSVIAKLVGAIDEEDWKEVEIIGWLYQFYISEKKDDVIGKVVKSEDIPAATQLFTPNWIVQYLVQNSVGRLWLMANPGSSLKAQWPYYIEPALQTPEVQAQLDALIQTRMDEDGGSLNPESITLLDPACGSGHILVEAYDVLKAIYLERGYQPRTIPRLILEKNLFGLDIDDRAAQMAGFALLMKARADDRRLFNEPIKLNVLALQESKGLDAEVLNRALQTVAGNSLLKNASIASQGGFGEDDLFPGTNPQSALGESIAADTGVAPMRAGVAELIDTFANAKTFGSLIQISLTLDVELVSMEQLIQSALQNGDLYAKAAAQDLLPLVAQARILGMQFDAVVANPPYMGFKGMNDLVKAFITNKFPPAKADLFAAFMVRNLELARTGGVMSMVTMHSWMFLPSYKELRPYLKEHAMLKNMAHLGPRAFDTISGEIVQTTAFTYQRFEAQEQTAIYHRLVDGRNEDEKSNLLLDRKNKFSRDIRDFDAVPESPLVYWMSEKLINAFETGILLENFSKPRQGMATADNERFLRNWSEVNLDKIAFECKSAADAIESKCRWFPYNKGGRYRKWYGNNDLVVNWENDGKDIKNFLDAKGKQRSAVRNSDFYFKPGITWTTTTSNSLAVRWSPPGFLFDVKGSSLFPGDNIALILGFLGSPVADMIMSMLNPTTEFQVGNMSSLPLKIEEFSKITTQVSDCVAKCLDLAKQDWDGFEISWDFQFPQLLYECNRGDTLATSWSRWSIDAASKVSTLKILEEENNRLFIEAYGLQDELSPEVPLAQITLACADRARDAQRLISYAIGCMMGRYSLDQPGVIYANSGNQSFDASRYATFSADADGIVPLTNELWFEDDAAGRIREFLLAVWGAATLAGNMDWLAESLGTKGSETSDETIRRYLAEKFYKDHLQFYKKRPIYWLFSSGKQGAFQALVYLHRYHEGTLARLRAEYVVPLTGKIQSHIDMLEKDTAAATSTAVRNKIAKEVENLKKRHAELLAYDEQLRHYADMRITLDLDDGVKVNYGKFGDLLAEVNAVTGGANDD